MQTLSILIPAFNEAARLPRTLALIKASKTKGIFEPWELKAVWVIDDGSSDETSKIAQGFALDFPEIRVQTLTPNQGKGHAIHTGLKLATSEWCLIADADSATPWDQFEKLKKACFKGEDRVFEIAIGSRDLPESQRLERQSWIRENLGRLFNLAVRWVTGLPFKDTQCGFKLLHLPSIQKFLPLLNIKRFAWDVELLLFGKRAGLRGIEVPVNWEHQEGSRISPLKDGIEMFFRVIQMRIRMAFLKESG